MYVRQILLIQLHESIPTFIRLIPLQIFFAFFRLVRGFAFFLLLATIFVRFSYLFFSQKLVKNVIRVICGYFQSVVLILLPGWVLFPACDRGEAILLLSLSNFGDLGIQVAVMKEVVVFVTLPAAEGNMLIIHCLIPVFILIL